MKMELAFLFIFNDADDGTQGFICVMLALYSWAARLALIHYDDSSWVGNLGVMFYVSTSRFQDVLAAPEK